MINLTPDSARDLIQKGLQDIERMQAQVDSGVNLFLIKRIEEFKLHISMLEAYLDKTKQSY